MIKAKYTIVLKTLMDDENVKPLIDKALSTYPILVPENNPEYYKIPTREELNNKLLNHYKYREIGFETIGRFLDELEISMNEIMPYYNQLLKTSDIINGLEDIFGNLDVEETYQETTSGLQMGESSGESNVEDSSTTETNTNGYNKSVKSSTPQGQLDISNKGIDTLDYADEVNWNHSTNEDQSTNSGESKSTTSSNAKNETSGTTEHTLKRKGNQGVNTYAHDMLEFRELIRNIELEIINHPRIQELFMLVY